MFILVLFCNIIKIYQCGFEKVQVLYGIYLDIQCGDFVVLMGFFGLGKIILLNLIGGLDMFSGGEIEIEGECIDQMSGGQLLMWCSYYVGFVFQFYNLMLMLIVQKNVELLLLLIYFGVVQCRCNVEIVLILVGFVDCCSYWFNEFFGGQQQCVVIVWVIVFDFIFLICDEFIGDLDWQLVEEILYLLQQFNCEYGKIIIMVIYDFKVVEYVIYIVYLDKGELVDVLVVY